MSDQSDGNTTAHPLSPATEQDRGLDVERDGAISSPDLPASGSGDSPEEPSEETILKRRARMDELAERLPAKYRSHR
jgi:hypothetical protein